MKVRCISNNNGELFLTVGKEYDVIKTLKKDGEVCGYEVENNFYTKRGYASKYFEIVEDEVKTKVCNHTRCINYDIDKENNCGLMFDISNCNHCGLMFDISNYNHCAKDGNKDEELKLQCSYCAHSIVCGHKKEWEEYCKEHIRLREKSVLFDIEPSCRYYLSENSINRHYHEMPKLNHIVEDTTEKPKAELTFKEFVDLLERILKEKE